MSAMIAESLFPAEWRETEPKVELCGLSQFSHAELPWHVCMVEEKHNSDSKSDFENIQAIFYTRMSEPPKQQEQR